MKTKIKLSPSFHITGNYPLRVADAEDRAESPFPWIVCFQRGFEQLQIAVYGDSLNACDAEESAVEWLTKHNPAALTDKERESGEADYVFSTEPENLDGFASPDDLETHAENSAQLGGPKSYLGYCENKAQAMRHRLAGRINEAIACENRCEALYKVIPDAWRLW